MVSLSVNEIPVIHFDFVEDITEIIIHFSSRVHPQVGQGGRGRRRCNVHYEKPLSAQKN